MIRLHRKKKKKKIRRRTINTNVITHLRAIEIEIRAEIVRGKVTDTQITEDILIIERMIGIDTRKNGLKKVETKRKN